MAHSDSAVPRRRLHRSLAEHRLAPARSVRRAEVRVPRSARRLAIRHWTGVRRSARSRPERRRWAADLDGAGGAAGLASRLLCGLFGGAAVINVANGTMFSYDAHAIQGYDQTTNGQNHTEPGDIKTAGANLNSGSENYATVFFGVPKDDAVTLYYPRPVDAISATFMHEYTMNEYNIQSGLNAASEWVMTFPTKLWYVDPVLVPSETQWIPDSADPGCGGWTPGDEPFPARDGRDYTDSVDQTDANSNGIPDTQEDWVLCSFVELDITDAIAPFTTLFDGEACEAFGFEIWDREENASNDSDNSIPPIVSPPPPGSIPPPGGNEMCYEVNVLRFGNDGVYPVIFGTPDFGGQSLLKTVDTGSVSYDGGAGSRTGYGSRQGR